jgi:hypothetical protein
MRPLPAKPNEDHRNGYQAIQLGDGETARAPHRNRRRYAKTVIVDLLQKQWFRFL